jgi:hypothetical protein
MTQNTLVVFTILHAMHLRLLSSSFLSFFLHLQLKQNHYFVCCNFILTICIIEYVEYNAITYTLVHALHKNEQKMVGVMPYVVGSGIW